MEIKYDVLGRFGEFGSARTVEKDGIKWYCANDILDVLMYTENNRSKTLARYCRNVIQFKISTPSKGCDRHSNSKATNSQTMNFIDKEDVILLIQHCRNVDDKVKIELLNRLDIIDESSNHIILPAMRKEIVFMNELKNILKKIYYLDSISQFQCGKYRIDLYIPSINLAIEYDENGHKNYDQFKEKEREDYIINTLKCRILRLTDFDTYNENLIKVMDILEHFYFKEIIELNRINNIKIVPIPYPVPYPVKETAQPLIRFMD